MKCYFDYNGTVPSGVEVVREGLITRLYFDFATDQKQFDGEEPITVLTAENVDVIGTEHGVLVNAIIRDRYTADAVEAIMANHAEAIDEESGITPEKRAEYIAEYQAFQNWRSKAKDVATAAEAIINA